MVVALSVWWRLPPFASVRRWTTIMARCHPGFAGGRTLLMRLLLYGCDVQLCSLE
jgi:hypothetical protein